MPELTDAHRRRLDEWVGSWEVVDDYSWPLQDTSVLRVDAGGRDLIVKASATSHHIRREIAAHREYLARFRGWVPTFRYASADDLILVADYLPGTLVEGTPAEADPVTYRRAGDRLACLLIPGTTSTAYTADLVAGSTAAIDAAGDLVGRTTLQALRTRLTSTRRPPARLSFTHGDFQPRNWLLHGGELRVTDEDMDLLALETIRQSIGTVVWAHGIGDGAFEEHGRRMIDRLLSGG